jgi:hypothetical protein
MIFSNACSYMGSVEYEVNGHGEPFHVTHRIAPPSDYERSIYNGTPEEFERDIIGKMFKVSLYLSCEKIPEEVFHGYVEHLTDHWNKWLDYCEQKKQKFKDDPEIRDIYERYGPACPLVYPAYWDNGWHELDYRRKI